jgi:hypothetical protein
MAVLIDPPDWHAHGRGWSHLVSDVSFDELHSFARALGVPERGFEGDHYDVPVERYAAAVAAGALPVPGRELLQRLRAAGLRRPKRRGEKVVASVPCQDGGRVDTLASALQLPAPARAAQAVVFRGGEVLVVADGGRVALPRTALAPGDVAAARVRSLVSAVLTGAGAGVPASVVQIGYLRFVPPDSRASSQFEVLLRWVPVDDAGTFVADGAVRWLAAEEIGSALAAPVAVLVLRAAHEHLHPGAPQSRP